VKRYKVRRNQRDAARAAKCSHWLRKLDDNHFMLCESVEGHALHCGIPSVEQWAARWLSGEDRTEKSAATAWDAARATAWDADEE
jgi:hypothetical protein